MAIELFGRKISKIGVVGSGNIGPDIALHFSKVGHRQGVPVVVNDVVQQAIDAGRERTNKKIQKGVETGSFKAAEAESMIKNITWTVNKQDLAGCDLVIEAATERLDIKRTIVAELEQICGPNAILASNSSHLEPERIFAEANRPDRALVIHYFFPAERNQLVEVVPGMQTDPKVADFCMKFYETIGKVPVRVGSRYGYAVDPIFEGLFLAAVQCVEAGLGSPKQIDAIAAKALGLGVGPFTAMNLTGGTPLTAEGFKHYHEKVSTWFHVPKLMQQQLEKKQPWEAAGKGEQVQYSNYDEVANRLMGAYFGIACDVLDAGIVDVGDLETAVEIGLVMTPPFRLMNQVGTDKALELVRNYKQLYPDFFMPKSLQQQSGRPWKIPYVVREDRGEVAVLTIKRPRVLNALNHDVIRSMQEQFEAVQKDPKIKAVVLTGFGVKAFVSGADIGMLASIKSPEDGVASSWNFQQFLMTVENLGKPVVCAMNGLALGGGLEVALACTVRIARPGLNPLCGLPEVKLGIMPGAGGTQRLPRMIPFEKAWRMIRTGETVSSEEAHKLGLVYELTEDVLERGVQLARDIAAGRARVPQINRGPYQPKPVEVDIGGLSKKIDSIVCKAVLEGAKLPLDQALKLESDLWGDVCRTQDMKIGLENFLKTGLKQPAQFVHA